MGGSGLRRASDGFGGHRECGDKKPSGLQQWLFERNAVHILSTDAHDTKRRTPSLSVARDKIAKLYGQDVAKALVDDNPRAVINDQPLPYFPNPVLKK